MHARGRGEREPVGTAQGGGRPISAPVLVGRDTELGVLAAACNRPPGVVLVEGEGGVGKTRLVQELCALDALAGRRVLAGACLELREPLPLGPVVDSIRTAPALPLRLRLSPAASALRPLLPELAGRLPDTPPPLDQAVRRHWVLRSLRELFAGLAPAVLVLEDVQWADDWTVDWLRLLGAQPVEGLVLLLTCRPQQLPPGSLLPGLVLRPCPPLTGLRLRLHPLDAPSVRALVSAILGVEEVSEAFASYVHERTGGLPFAVEEIVRLVQDRRDLVQLDGRWLRRRIGDLQVPPAVREVVLERLARLPPDAQAVAQAAAVLDVAASETLLAAVAGLGLVRVREGLTDALGAALLVEHERGVAFRHTLARQAVYDAIPGPTRRGLHLRAAQALEHVGHPAARLARQWREAGEQDRWVSVGEAAADEASVSGDDWSASQLLLELLSGPGLALDARVRLAGKLGSAALHGMAHAPAVRALEQVLSEPGLAPRQRGELRVQLGWLRVQAGDRSAGYRDVAAAIDDLAHRADLQVQAMATLAAPCVPEGSVAEHLTWLERAVDAASRHHDASIRTGALIDRACVLLYLGEPSGWDALAEVPRGGATTEERRELARGLVNLAEVMTVLGHYDRAEATLREGVARSRDAGSERFLRDAEVLRLLLDWAATRWDGLPARARVLADAAADVPHTAVVAELVLGRLLLARGERGEAEALLRRAADVAMVAGELPMMLAAVGGLVRLRLGEGRAKAAVLQAQAGVELLEGKGVWAWGAELVPPTVEGLTQLGDHARAAALTAAFGAGLLRRDAPAATAALGVCEATVAAAAGDDAAAVSCLREAEQAWRALGRHHEAALARHELGLLLLDDDREAAVVLVTGALDELQRLGATWDAGRLRREVRRRGVALARPWRGGRRGYGQALSPKEQEVVALAVGGLTNRQIGEQLYLSPYTVKNHLASAMRKLGVSSRKELAGAGTPGQ